MSIYSSNLISAQLSTTTLQVKPNKLKLGQILSGKVIEIYPDQRAMIQLGEQKVVAQLKTGLKLNKNYWFQVQTNDQLLHLKVLFEKSDRQSLEQQASSLLKQLHLPLTKENLIFVQKVVQTQITFIPESLRQALELNANNKNVSMPYLLEMMANQLPITSSIYKSLTSAKTNSLRQQLQQVYQQLKASEYLVKDKQLVLTRVESMLNKSNNNWSIKNIIYLINQQIDQKETVLLQTLKQTGILAEHYDINQTKEIKNQLQSMMVRHGESYIGEKLGTVFSKQLGLTDQQISQFKKLMQVMIKLEENPSAQIRTQQQLQAFIEKHHLRTKISMFLSEVERETFHNWKQDSNWKNIESIVQKIKNLADQQLSQQIENKVVELLSSTKNNTLSLKDQFLLQLKHFLNFSGILDEYQLLKDDATNSKQNYSLKQLLLQTVHTSTVGQQDIEQLVHTINGLQITSVQEEGAFIQTSIQLPSFLESKHDIFIDMESKKNESNQIDPDYCHIVFFISLEKIGDTCIDMSVINRKINLSVYNHHPEIIPFIDSLKPMLQNGLAGKEYQLLSVQFKQMTERIEQQIMKKKDHTVTKVGVDIRI
ncbi:hypothetical protein BN1058_02040 [Paraliobacillus sp. PM-2]|uniref:hypothetical protein n=1 Tax=Paraliobacillus sp. PM-2 TaxID=1462524 RepID=UPI00061C401B|nr:hypothetical protein [Paraliobacillus sp. PM-2]CQR47713.1 hypothetical protein BN1058_02040 [Paraliobacillus sp. PM-2]